jgi:uncharacterized protein (DUF1330 family)
VLNSSIDLGAVAEADEGAWQFSPADRVSAVETGLAALSARGAVLTKDDPTDFSHGLPNCSPHGLEILITYAHGKLASKREEEVMKSQIIALLAGVAIGATAIQGLYAQGAKPKAYVVVENEILDASAQAAYLPIARKLIAEHHGRALRTAAGRVVGIEGGAPPKSAAISEWDSVDDAVAFYKSKAWTDLAPQRDKAVKVIRRYAVEVEK